jgi:hypothetical protein
MQKLLSWRRSSLAQQQSTGTVILPATPSQRVWLRSASMTNLTQMGPSFYITVGLGHNTNHPSPIDPNPLMHVLGIVMLQYTNPEARAAAFAHQGRPQEIWWCWQDCYHEQTHPTAGLQDLPPHPCKNSLPGRTLTSPCNPNEYHWESWWMGAGLRLRRWQKIIKSTLIQKGRQHFPHGCHWQHHDYCHHSCSWAMQHFHHQHPRSFLNAYNDRDRGWIEVFCHFFQNIPFLWL